MHEHDTEMEGSTTTGGARGRAGDNNTDAANMPAASEKKVDRECRKCQQYLTNVLNRVGGSRPQSLLRALGVISHPDSSSSSSSSGSSSKVYEIIGGRGVLISLQNDKESTADLQQQQVGIKQVDGINDDKNSNMHHGTVVDKMKKKHTIHKNYKTEEGQNIKINNNNNIPLSRRITKVAEYMDGLVPNGDLLTTSPVAVDNTDQNDISSNEKVSSNKVTTIAIECIQCGSDTRAEGGARAFVRGPDPLSIVLCSNRLSSQREVEEVLVHELVHIYDVHSKKMDLRDCRQLAYSEVRAAREAECRNR